MPLVKRPIGSITPPIEPPKTEAKAPEETADTAQKESKPAIVHKRDTPMTKDDYWRRREEHDGQRDKDMAWSGLAQAALGSVLIAQLNTDNTEDGLVKLVARITDKLLQARESR